MEAPFWDQPLIRDFIAAQRPLPTIKTRAGGGGGYLQVHLFTISRLVASRGQHLTISSYLPVFTRLADVGYLSEMSRTT